MIKGKLTAPSLKPRAANIDANLPCHRPVTEDAKRAKAGLALTFGVG
jgi:hypothetical protein